MPQERRRSISYRSFVTCDDPKGVECGAIRKSKINPQKKEQDNSSNIEADRKQRNQNTSVEVAVIKEEREKKEMGIRGITRERLETPASFQLLEVSKEADRLNHVISSLSNDNLLKKKQDYIAEDLLRGALDLQDSLVMLGKLQEASSYMMGLARKQKQKLKEGTFDGMVSGVRGFQRPSVGEDECPRKSVDEMRNAVRDSLLRQNVITNPIFEEHYYDHRKMASPDMMPSTSSSQSSMVHSSNFVPSDSSVSSPASQRRKGKNSNVVVKLMGLESFPSSPRKHMEREKIMNMEKPVYEIDSPRAKRLHFGDQEGSMKQRSVEEILNSKFKGLLRNNSVNDMAVDSPESEDSSSEDCWEDERPPIVLMKPFRYPCIDLDKPFLAKSQGEMGMKPRYSRESAREVIRNGVKFSEKYEKEGKGVDCEEKAKSIKKVASLKPQKKQAEVRKASVVEKVTPIRRKGDEKKDAIASDQSTSRDQEKLSTANIRRHKDGKCISKNSTSSQEKTTPTPMLDYRKRGTSERRKNRQPTLILEEKQICKDKIHENLKTKIVYREDIDLKDDISSFFTTVNSRIDHGDDKERCQILTSDYDIDSRSTVLRTPEEIPNLPNDKKISHFDDNLSCYSEITSVSTSECCNTDQLDETQSPVREVTLITTHEDGVAVHHDTNQEENKSPKNSITSSEKTDNETLTQSLTLRMKLKALLLSNPFFMSQVEDLFNIQVNPGFASFVVDDSDEDLENAQLLIDCANEVLHIKSLQLSQVRLPLSRMYMAKSQNSISLDGLLEEVCNEIEELSCYLRLVSDDEFPSNNIYVIIDQDLRFGSKSWGVGWRHMFTQDEVDQVIGEVDKFVLSKLIEEVISDFML